MERKWNSRINHNFDLWRTRLNWYCLANILGYVDIKSRRDYWIDSAKNESSTAQLRKLAFVG